MGAESFYCSVPVIFNQLSMFNSHVLNNDQHYDISVSHLACQYNNFAGTSDVGAAERYRKCHAPDIFCVSDVVIDLSDGHMQLNLKQIDRGIPR